MKRLFCKIFGHRYSIIPVPIRPGASATMRICSRCNRTEILKEQVDKVSQKPLTVFWEEVKS